MKAAFVIAALAASVASAAPWGNGTDDIQALIEHAKSLLPSAGATNVTVCWKDSYARGAGKVIDSCPSASNPSKSGLLCYPACSAGMVGVGPVCWEECQQTYADEGALCGRSGSIHSADNSACPWFDKCGLVSAKGCSKCAAADGVHNDGCTCRVDASVYAKKSYGRSAGVPLGCAPDVSDEQAALCYAPCKSGMYGVGPVCWEGCGGKFPASGGAMCCATPGACNEKVVQVAEGVLTALSAAIEAGMDSSKTLAAIKAAIDAILGFVMPLCDD